MKKSLIQLFGLYPLLRTISITGDFKYYLHPSLDSVSEYIHNKARLGFI